MQREDKLLIGSEAPQVIASLIAEAKASIRFMSFVATTPQPSSHLVYAALWRWLRDAPARNVECCALFAGATPASSQGITNRQAAASLSKSGWHCRAASGSRLIHAKIWIFDNERAVLGSHNLTEAGMLRNVEYSLVMHQPAIVQRLSDNFAQQWLKGKPF